MPNKFFHWTNIFMAAVLAGLSMTAVADNSSRANAHHMWDPYSVIGQSMLYRSEDGLKANFKLNANATDNDRVITLWFVVFNSPENCLTTPCGVADLSALSPAQGDFLYGGGIITTENKAEFGGSIATGDKSGSGFNELGQSFLAVGVTDPENAEVHLLLHSHGPSLSGEDLAYQISSFLGGCEVFLGNADGFAQGPQDVPDEPGECSTHIFSIHFP